MGEQQVGNYRLIARLGAGGTGTVYKAQQENLGRIVALKVLHPAYAGDQGLLTRFKREIEISSALNHPNLLRVYDAGHDGDRWYFSMEFIEGHPLRKRIKAEKKLAPKEAAQIARQLLEAMAYFHPQGMIHRDIKPENILQQLDGTVKLMDFGIVKVTDKTVLTAVGSTLGTPRYMSPEMVTGETQDATSDLFQFGVVFYELLTGACPFDGATISEIAYKITDCEPSPPSKISAGLTESFDALVLRCLAKNPRDRYQTADEVLDDLGAIELELSSGGESPRSGQRPAISRIGSPPSRPIGARPPASGPRTVVGTAPPATPAPLSQMQLKDSLKSITMEMTRSPALPWVAAVIFTGLLCVAVALIWPRFFKRIEMVGDLQLIPGPGAFMARWTTNPESNTRIGFQVVGSNEKREASNSEQPHVLEHSLIVDRNLDPSSEVIAWVIFPDDSKTRTATVKIPADLASDQPSVLEGSPAVETDASGEYSIKVVTRWPMVSKVRFIREGAEVKRPVSEKFVTEHRVDLGAVKDDESITNVVLEVTGVGIEKTFSLPSVHGPKALLEALLKAMGQVSDADLDKRAIDLDRQLAQLARVKTPPQDTPQFRKAVELTREFLDEREYTGLLESLRIHQDKVLAMPESREFLPMVLGPLQKLESFDYISYVYTDIPLVDTGRSYDKILRRGTVVEEPGDGILLRNYESEKVFNYITRRYVKESKPEKSGEFYAPKLGEDLPLGDIVQQMRDGDEFTFNLPPGWLKDRAQVAFVLQVANMKPDTYFCFTLDNTVIMARNDDRHKHYAFQDLFYGEYAEAVSHSFLTSVTFPSFLLEEGENKVKVFADSMAGKGESMGASLLKLWLTDASKLKYLSK